MAKVNKFLLKVVLVYLAGMFASTLGFLIFFLAFGIISTVIDIGFGGDKSAGLLGILLGLPIGATVGIAFAHRALFGRKRLSFVNIALTVIVGTIGCYKMLFILDQVRYNAILYLSLGVTLLTLTGYSFLVFIKMIPQKIKKQELQPPR